MPYLIVAAVGAAGGWYMGDGSKTIANAAKWAAVAVVGYYGGKIALKAMK
jgi:hypothetical protein